MFLIDRYALSLSVVLGALILTTGAFLLTRPQVRPAGQEGKAIEVPSYVSLAERGWTWPSGLPGFRIGHDEDRWNFSAIRWADLAGLRLASRAAAVDPQSLRVLYGARLRPKVKPYLLVGGRDARGRTCIGAQAPRAEPALFCRPELAGRSAVVIAAPQPQSDGWTIWINGVVNASVTRVTVEAAGVTFRSDTGAVRQQGPLDMFQRQGNRTWGTFTWYQSQPVPWNATLVFYGAHGKIATLPLRFTQPGAHVYLR